MNEAGVRTTGKWSKPGVPHRGWTCIDIEDLGEPSAVCEMCEAQDIRYVHHMQHPEYPDLLGCGCVCAGRMEEDYTRARNREKIMRQSAGRKTRWLSRRWLISREGNPYLNTDGYHVVVFSQRSTTGGPSWGFRVTNRATDDVLRSRRDYSTLDAAKLRAFDAIIWMKERGR